MPSLINGSNKRRLLIFNLLLRLSSLIVTHSGSLNSNKIVYLSSDFFSGFLNNILFVWPLFGLFLESILPETPYPEQSTEVYELWGSRLYNCLHYHIVLYHFNQFGRPCYTLHACQNFEFGTWGKWPFDFFLWFRHLAKMTITTVTFRRFWSSCYMLLLNRSKWYSIFSKELDQMKV